MKRPHISLLCKDSRVAREAGTGGGGGRDRVGSGRDRAGWDRAAGAVGAFYSVDTWDDLFSVSLVSGRSFIIWRPPTPVVCGA